MTRTEALAYVDGFSRSGKPVKDLSRIAGLMHRLGDPQDSLRFIHIAGTNGKGSVAEYLTNILRRSGYRTGTFTSPYILCYEDRIRLNGENIPEDALCRACAQVAAVVNGDEGFSQFEITFAIAMLYYAAAKAEIVVLEAGLGGLLDCTNIIQQPLCSVITSVSYDHMAILGDTIEEIAAQKAGIMKQGRPVVWNPFGEAKLASFKARAEELHCDLHWQEFYFYQQDGGAILRIGLTGNEFVYKDTRYQTRMGGMHQIDNAMTALVTADVLREEGYAIPVEAVQAGLAETQIPGRIQVLQTEPPVILDGGHNRDGVAKLAEALGESCFPAWVGICGMTHGDAIEHTAAKMAPLLTKVYCVDGFVPQAVPAETLCRAFREKGVQAEILSGDVLGTAQQQGSPAVIFGSLFLVSAVLNREV